MVWIQDIGNQRQGKAATEKKNIESDKEDKEGQKKKNERKGIMQMSKFY